MHGRRQAMILVALAMAMIVDAAWSMPLRLAKATAAAACCAARCREVRATACQSACCPTTGRVESPTLPAAPSHPEAQPLVTVLSAIGAVLDPPVPILVALERAGTDPPTIRGPAPRLRL
jgi:hypothetical protein